MYLTGVLTTVLFSVSLAFYFFAAYFPNFFIAGSIIGTLTFLGGLLMSYLIYHYERIEDFRHDFDRY